MMLQIVLVVLTFSSLPRAVIQPSTRCGRAARGRGVTERKSVVEIRPPPVSRNRTDLVTYELYL